MIFGPWRRRQEKARATIAEPVWRATVEGLPFLHGLAPDEEERLRDLAARFLAEKELAGAAGLEITEAMGVTIAAQACLPIMNLGWEWFEGWVSVVVYPAEFAPVHEWVDEDGIAHVSKEPRMGEAWFEGPVILSWEDVANPWAGVNVVIHEFAHKLDMKNGDTNGFPPLQPGMSRERWSRAMGAAYGHLGAAVEAGEETWLDPYAAESPGEFFAVMSEAFFTDPHVLEWVYPEVYGQLVLLYRQDPRGRLPPPPEWQEAPPA